MRSATGTYRLEPDSASFFGSTILRVIARGQAVVGRYGRHGVFRGAIENRIVQARWEDSARRGWIELRFDPEYQCCEIRYGLNGSSASGSSTIHRIHREATRNGT